MVRPKKEDPKSVAVQVRLDGRQAAWLDRVVTSQAELLHLAGAEVSRASVVRGLINKAMQEEAEREARTAAQEKARAEPAARRKAKR